MRSIIDQRHVEELRPVDVQISAWSGRIKSEACAIIPRMAVARCKVSFTDSDGVSHTAHVQAESLYEAVALATAEFKDDHIAPKPGPTTEFTVAMVTPMAPRLSGVMASGVMAMVLFTN